MVAAIPAPAPECVMPLGRIDRGRRREDTPARAGLVVADLPRSRDRGSHRARRGACAGRDRGRLDRSCRAGPTRLARRRSGGGRAELGRSAHARAPRGSAHPRGRGAERSRPLRPAVGAQHPRPSTLGGAPGRARSRGADRSRAGAALGLATRWRALRFHAARGRREGEHGAGRPRGALPVAQRGSRARRRARRRSGHAGGSSRLRSAAPLALGRHDRARRPRF